MAATKTTAAKATAKKAPAKKAPAAKAAAKPVAKKAAAPKAAAKPAAKKVAAPKAAAKPVAKKAAAPKAAAKPVAKKAAAPKAVKAVKAAAPKAVKAAKAEAVAVASKTTAITEKYSKTQIVAEIADVTALSKKEVSAVLEELNSIIERHVKKRGVGEFTLPGLLKIKTIKKPAQKARKGVPNPFRPGELMDVAAKPATTKVKVLALKKLKDIVSE